MRREKAFLKMLNLILFWISFIICIHFYTYASSRVLFIGIDGGSWEIIKPLVDSNDLPNFKKLIKQGVRGDTFSSSFWSQEIWASMFTGKTPKEHGMTGFVNLRDGHLILMASSTQRKVEALWNILSRKGLKSAFISFLNTWPVEEIRGYMISQWAIPWYFLKYHKILDLLQLESINENTLVYPLELSLNINNMFVGIFIDVNREMKKEGFPLRFPLKRLRKYRNDMEKDIKKISEGLIKKYKLSYYQPNLQIPFIIIDMGFLPQIVYAITKYPFEIAKELIVSDSDLVFMGIYVGSTDIIEHLYWPTDRRIPPYKIDAIRNLYKYIDKKLGELFSLLSSDWTVIIVSDHGGSSWQMELYGGGPIHKRENAIFIIKGKGIKEGVQLTQPINVIDIFSLLSYIIKIDNSFSVKHPNIFREIFKEEIKK